MKCLIVEDDQVSSRVLEKMIARYGSSDLVANGQDAVEQFRQAHDANLPYDLVLMDIMMPEIDGLKAVLAFREMESLLGIPGVKGVKVIMTTALVDPRTVMKALYESGASSYLIKPIRLQKLEEELRALKLIS
jgi:two-component system, chemotaxis family, chemotaxis protein CheY